MRSHCPTCGVRFDRKPEEAFFLGAFVIQTGIILLPLAILVFLYGLSTGGVVGGPPWAYGLAAVLHSTLTPLLTYPISKTVWFAVDLAMTELDADEVAEARAVAAASPPVL